MKCPNCAAVAGDGASECPACGLVFSKWKELEVRRKLEASAALSAVDVPSARTPNLWTGRIVAGILVAAWLIGLSFYYRRRMAEVKRPKGVPTGEFVEMRDPVTGDMRRMPIRRLVSPQRPAGAAPAAPAPPPEETPAPAETPGSNPPLPRLPGR